ncbi:hypothetical protein Tco_0496199 [Tanacetum coccineum]
MLDIYSVVDSASEDMQAHATEVVKMVKAASWCLQADITERPSMICDQVWHKTVVEQENDLTTLSPSVVSGSSE